MARPGALGSSGTRAAAPGSIGRTRDYRILRLADSAAGAGAGTRNSDGLLDAAAGTGCQCLSRPALAMDSGFRSAQVRRLGPARRQGRGRQDLVAALRGRRPTLDP